MSSRIAPATPPYSEKIDAALAAVMPAGMEPLLLFRVLARNVRVCERFLAGGLLDKGSISLRERELVILRTTARCGSSYEWGVHVAGFARAAGFNEAAIDATVTGRADDPAWTHGEQLVIALVDALHDRAQVEESLWAALKEHYTDEQLIELVVLTGFYHTVSFATNTFRLPSEEGAPGFPGPRS